MNPQLGAVVIGRNEGNRLVRCLQSLLTHLPEQTPIVYVDSGSTDGSVHNAQELGVHVIELDMTVPFTMARGRNTGFQYLMDHFPHLRYVQFIDGDCELLPNWIEQATAALEQDPKLAIVCGRRVERFPDASPYNRLADMEWNTSVGETTACGGDALTRVEAIQSVEGYNPSLICGEEPEMCIRLRQNGWKIRRLDVTMTLHDAAMLKFSQWWTRCIRGGWAIAEGKAMYGNTPEKYMVREAKSGWLWGLLIPSLALGLAWLSEGRSFALLLAYPVLTWRIYRYRTVGGDTPRHARIYAVFCVVSKLPQLIGQLRYGLSRWQNQKPTLIEYKLSPASDID